MKIISIAFVGFLLLSSVALGQDKSDRLAKLTKTLHEKIEKDKPGWAHRSIPIDLYDSEPNTCSKRDTKPVEHFGHNG